MHGRRRADALPFLCVCGNKTSGNARWLVELANAEKDAP